MSVQPKQAGAWYRLSLLVDVPTSGQLTVGCRAGSGGTTPVYMDDFRFQPLLAPSTAYVYDPATRQLTHALDNENLFTHYEYDAAGKVKRVAKEVFLGTSSSTDAERLLKEYSYNFAQMGVANWLPTGVVTWSGSGPAGDMRPRQHEERDINPLSRTYNTTRMVSDGISIACVSDCPAAGTILYSGCDSRTEPDDKIVYYKYYLRAKGNCTSYRDEYSTSSTPIPDSECNP